MTTPLLFWILTGGALVLLTGSLWFLLRERRKGTQRIETHTRNLSSIYTTQRQATTGLRQSIDFLALLKATLDAANIGVTVVDVTRNEIVYVNRFDAELHGYASHDLIGTVAKVYAPTSFHLPDTDRFPKIAQNTYVSLNQHRNGKVFPVRLYTSVYEVGGTPYKVTFCQRIVELAPYEAFILGEQDVLLLVLDEHLNFFWANDRIHAFFPTTFPDHLCDFFSEQECHRILLRGERHDEFPHRYTLTSETGDGVDVVFSLFHGVWYYFLIGRHDPTADSRANTSTFLHS